MKRVSGQIITTTSYDETVSALLPNPLPPSSPELDAASFTELNEKAEKSLARLKRSLIQPRMRSRALSE